MTGIPLTDVAKPTTHVEYRRIPVISGDTLNLLPPSGSRRYVSIDVLRCAAILLMVQVHFVENLSSREASSGWLFDVCALFSTVPAPLFLFASGLSFCLWVRKQRTSGRPESEITRVAVRRGLFLFGAGIAFNFFVWLPEDTFNWDILTLIGTSLLFLAFARRLPPVVLALIGVMVLLLSPPLRVVGDYSAYWENGAYTYDFTLRDVLFGFVSNGFFPMFPWIVFPLAGYLTGETWIQNQVRGTPFTKRALTAGIVLMSISAAGVAFGARAPYLIAKHYTAGFSEYPASTGYVLGAVGLCLACFALLHCLFDREEETADGPLHSGRLLRGRLHSGPLLRFIRRYSEFSLTVYIVHSILHLWPLWCYGVWMGQDDPTFYWKQAVPTPTAFGLGIAFVILCSFCLIVLERHKRFTFESLMRWICD